jgi:hypothetical protein
MEVRYRQGGFLAIILRGSCSLCWCDAAKSAFGPRVFSLSLWLIFAVSVLILGLSTGDMNKVVGRGRNVGVEAERDKVNSRVCLTIYRSFSSRSQKFDGGF